MRCHSLLWTPVLHSAFVPHSFEIRLARKKFALVETDCGREIGRIWTLPNFKKTLQCARRKLTQCGSVNRLLKVYVDVLVVPMPYCQAARVVSHDNGRYVHEAFTYVRKTTNSYNHFGNLRDKTRSHVIGVYVSQVHNDCSRKF